jgi:hypothetical protein
MKKLNTVNGRILIAIVLSISFIAYPQLRVSAAEAVRAAAELKSESQYRAEAIRYDSAVRAMAGIVTMKLETPDDLKKAHAIVANARPSLKLFRSKFVVMSLSDPTFTDAVKKRSPNKKAAEDLIKEINADQRAVLKLNGAEALKNRIEQSIKTDAGTLRLASERLKAAGETLKKAGQASGAQGPFRDDFKVIQASFKAEEQPIPAGPSIPPQDPFTIGIVIIATIAIAVVLLEVILFGVVLVLEEDRTDSLDECLDDANARYETCEASAREQPFPLNIAQLVICDGFLLALQAACMIR